MQAPVNLHSRSRFPRAMALVGIVQPSAALDFSAMLEALPTMRRLYHYVRGHTVRRVRTVMRGMAFGQKLRMSFSHVQLISMLPSTFLLNSLHGVPDDVSSFFSSRGIVYAAIG